MSDKETQMTDYQPVDLSQYHNAGQALAGEGQLLPLGHQTFHGLPFQLGDDAERCLLALGRDVCMDDVTIPMTGAARYVIVAHRLLDSEIEQGDPVGRICAEYRFRYEDGQEVTAPIRERFEIAVVPQPWGQKAFIAFPDRKDNLWDRYTGPWEAAGNQLTEASAGYPRNYYLYTWSNPRPEAPLTGLTIHPSGPRFYIGGITLGFLDEFPFTRQARREVRIVLKNPDDAQQRFAMQVEVDRGWATYPYPLPEGDADSFLKDAFAGWGETHNRCASPAYTAIAATPSATVTVKQDDETLGAFCWGDLERDGVAEPTPRLRVELVDRGRNWVHTTVLDDETDKPVPCRIHFRSLEGIPFQPHGHHSHVNGDLGSWHMDVGGDVRLGQINYAYIDGRCQGWLPRGEVLVDVARGFEYEPLRAKVALVPGQRDLTLRLKRRFHMNQQRYFSGDTHVHFLSTQGSHVEGAGEGLNVVNLLQSQWAHLFSNTEEFTGRPSVSADGETIVYATQENRQHVLGHLSLLGLTEPVMPWGSGGPDEAELGGNLETTLSRWADACHQQGGTVVIPHLPNPNCEPAALITTGRADAIEMLAHDPYFHIEYYRYLNCGYKLPLCGGTDKMSADVPVGIYRTYVYIPPDEPFTYDNWLRNLRKGNTFLSGGPMLQFTVEGRPIGDTIELPGNGGTLRIEAEAESVLPIHSLEIVCNGEVVARTEMASGAQRLTLREDVEIKRHSWLAARCAGPNYTSVKHFDGWRRGIMAHTSPIYMAVGEPWWMFDAGTANYLLTLLHGGIDHIRQRSAQWTPGSVTHHHHHDDHLEFLEEPFRQAIDAIHRRMHQLNLPH